jgi:hypothetical protein
MQDEVYFSMGWREPARCSGKTKAEERISAQITLDSNIRPTLKGMDRK